MRALARRAAQLGEVPLEFLVGEKGKLPCKMTAKAPENMQDPRRKRESIPNHSFHFQVRFAVSSQEGI